MNIQLHSLWSESIQFSSVAQLCPTLCNPMDCGPPGSSIHGIFQARVLEWVAISFSRGSSQPRGGTWVSCTAGRLFTDWARRDALVVGLKTRRKWGCKPRNASGLYKLEMTSVYSQQENEVLCSTTIRNLILPKAQMSREIDSPLEPSEQTVGLPTPWF